MGVHGAKKRGEGGGERVEKEGKKKKEMFIFTPRPRRPNKISSGRENKSLRIRRVYFVGLRKHADMSVERALEANR